MAMQQAADRIIMVREIYKTKKAKIRNQNHDLTRR